VHRALVIQTSFLGDVVLTTPLLQFLASQSYEVDVVTTPAGGALLEGHSAVRRVIRYDKRGAEGGVAGLRRLARSLAREAYQTAYLAQGSLRSAALAWWAKIPARAGFNTSSGRVLYTHRVPYRRDWHHSRRLLSLAAADASTVPAPSLFPQPVDHAAVDAVLSSSPVGHMPFVALAPGSVWATKRWPSFDALLMHLPQPLGVVVIGGADDHALAEAIRAVAPHRVLNATGRLSLLASAEMIRRARALVTNDSLPQHLASAMNTPTLTIFGPTLPAFGFGPLAMRHAVVEHAGGLDCRPCSAHGPQVCPRAHFKCMREIAPQRVAESLHQLLHH
jgi:heptosyltransferase II